MTSSPRTLISVATYNEMDNLPSLVEAIFEHTPQVELLVVDDNSPDGTGRWCDEHATGEPRMHCLHRAGKLGLGTATLAGLQYAIDGDYDYVINMDADFSHHPKYLPDLLAGMQPDQGPPRDVMIGSRYTPGGGVQGWPLRRRVMSRCVNMYARTLLRLKTTDCSGSFRCYRISKLRELDLDAFVAKGYAVYEEILWRLKRVGATFGETPIIFTDREQGQSKINMREAFAALGIIFRLGVGLSR